MWNVDLVCEISLFTFIFLAYEEIKGYAQKSFNHFNFAIPFSKIKILKSLNFQSNQRFME